jgi:hypothetical protein
MPLDPMFQTALAQLANAPRSASSTGSALLLKRELT